MAPRKKDAESVEELSNLEPPSEGVVEPAEEVVKEPEPVPKTKEKTYTELYFENLGKPIPDSVEIEHGYCMSCQEKLRTGLHGESMCPAQLKVCPRHNS